MIPIPSPRGPAVRRLAAVRAPVRCGRPLLAVIGSSGSGKTRLLESLIPVLRDRGIRVAVIKHAHCDVDLDKPGKDSHRLATAGAPQVMLASRGGWAIMGRNDETAPEPSLEWLAGRLDLEHVDLVLAEGFHFERCARVEVVRPSRGIPPFSAPGDPDLLAVVSDAAPAGFERWLDLNDVEAVAACIVAFMERDGRVSEAV